MKAVQLENVSMRFESPDGAPPLEVIRGMSLEVSSGEAVAVVGPSGSGKSTLLNIIGGLEQPTGGTVFLAGRDIYALSEKELALIRNRQIGFVFQLHHLLPQCTVLENVLLPTVAYRMVSEKQSVNRAEMLLERVGLHERRSHRPGQLSGGECQRVAVVRALINSPDLVLADEPTGSLDQETAVALAELLVELNEEENTTLILVTHSLTLAERMKKRLKLTGGQLDEMTVNSSP